jgi:hypothetical protein
MAAAFQSGSSFIPKNSLERPTEATSSSVGLLFVISLMILLISAIVFGGTMLYKSLVYNEINAPCNASGDGAQRCGLRATVDREQRNIDQLTIQALERLDKKLDAVGKLVEQHKDLLRIFKLLESNTLSSVGYTSFAYSPKNITLDGQALGFEDIAVQSQVFTEAKRNNQLQEFMFSDLDQDQKGRVKFKLTLVINPNLVLASTPITQ